MFKIFNTIRKNNQGFSIAELMVAVGIFSVVTIAITQIQQTSTTTVKELEEKSYETELISAIALNLLKTEACTKTLSGLALGAPQELNDIKNKDGNPVFKIKTELTSAEMVGIPILIKQIQTQIPTVDANGYGNIKLKVVFEKTSKFAKRKDDITHEFDLKVSLTPGKQIITCKSVTENAESVAPINSCTALNGVVSGDKCQLKSYPAVPPTDRNTAVSTKYLEDYFKNGKPAEKYVIKDKDDSMTGALIVQDKIEVQGNITTNKEFCVGGGCQDFTEKRCNTSEIAIGINPDGSPQCIGLCSDTKTAFAGLEIDKSIRCVPLPTTTCPSNQYATSINYNPVTKTTDISCSTLPLTANISCAVGYYVRSIISGVPICIKDVVPALLAPSRVMTGIRPSDMTISSTAITSSYSSKAIYRGVSFMSTAGVPAPSVSFYDEVCTVCPLECADSSSVYPSARNCPPAHVRTATPTYTATWSSSRIGLRCKGTILGRRTVCTPNTYYLGKVMP